MGKSAARLLLCTLLPAIAGVGPAVAAPSSGSPPGVIRGIVVAGDARPIANVSVAIQEQDGSALHQELRTDASGTFSASGLPPGRYDVIAGKAGLLSQSFEVVVLAGQMADVAFRLAPDPDAGVKQRQAQAVKQEQLVTRGLELASAGRFDEAAARFRQAANAGPDCAICFHDLGRAEMARHDYAAAETAYQRAAALDPTDAGAFAELAQIYNRQRRFLPAVDAGAHAIALSADRAPAVRSALRFNQGIYLWNAKRPAEALQEFQTAVHLDPGNAEAHYRLALALINQGQTAPAVAALDRYLTLQPAGTHAAHARALLAGLGH